MTDVEELYGHDLFVQKGIFKFHQSFLGEYLLCPERARLQWFKVVPSGPTDATAIGTGAHAGVEHVIRGGSAADGWEKAVETFLEETRHPLYRWVQVKTEATALKHMQCAMDGLLLRVVPYLGTPIWVEHRFDVHFQTITLPNGREVEIRLGGTIDFGDETGLWDWKSRKADSTKYKAGWGGEGWKLKRFGIQPTVYTTAADIEGFWDDLPHTGGADDPWTFTFAAASKTTREVDILEVERTRSDVEWLRQLTANVAIMLTSGLPEFPKNDQHALCSGEWCPAWSICKGAESAESAVYLTSVS